MLINVRFIDDEQTTMIGQLDDLEYVQPNDDGSHTYEIRDDEAGPRDMYEHLLDNAANVSEYEWIA